MSYLINCYTVAFQGPRALGHLRYDGGIHYDMRDFPTVAARASFETELRSMGTQLVRWDG